MAYIEPEQIALAREMDLLTYLRKFEPQELVHKGGNVYSTRTHDSLKISNGKWCWWSRNIGGKNALDYLTKVEGVPFLDAVQRILGAVPMLPATPEQVAPVSKTEFALPPKRADNRRVFSYLHGRGIAPEIITTVSKQGSSMRTDSGTTVCSSALKESNPGMRPCGERSQKSVSWVKSPAVISGFPLLFR